MSTKLEKLTEKYVDSINKGIISAKSLQYLTRTGTITAILEQNGIAATRENIRFFGKACIEAVKNI